MSISGLTSHSLSAENFCCLERQFFAAYLLLFSLFLIHPLIFECHSYRSLVKFVFGIMKLKDTTSSDSERSTQMTTTLSATSSQSINEACTLLKSSGPIQRKAKKKRIPLSSVHSAASINYRGVNIYQAAAQGSLPICVLLWGMASAKRVNLMSPDARGNNPLHMAAQADTPEVRSQALLLPS